jgi:hypothetical protein
MQGGLTEATPLSLARLTQACQVTRDDTGPFTASNITHGTG